MRQQIDSHPPPLPPVKEEMHTKPSQHAHVHTDEVSYVTLKLSCDLSFVMCVWACALINLRTVMYIINGTDEVS